MTNYFNTWFYSDPHFLHANIVSFSGRPFEDVTEMNEALVENWNRTVGDDDLIWVLGDVAMGSIADSLALCARLRGRKFLLCGNHDRPWAGARHSAKQSHNWAKRYIDEGRFEVVLDGGTVPVVELHSDLGDVAVQLCHFPRVGDHTVEERYKEWRPKDDGGWLLHGHVHEAWHIDPPNRQINVGVDVNDFRPVQDSALAEIILGYGVDDQ